jgi:hypothetical protein
VRSLTKNYAYEDFVIYLTSLASFPQITFKISYHDNKIGDQMLRRIFIVAILIAILVSGSSFATAQSENLAVYFIFLHCEQYLIHSSWCEAQTKVDAQGGIHSTFVDNHFVYYAYCSGNCSNISSWQAVKVAASGTYSPLAKPTLVVDSNGRSRIVRYVN